MSRQISFIIVLAGWLGLVNVSAQTPELAQAKAKLEVLVKELTGLDAKFQADLAAALAEKVDLSPKGEFESTEDYKARLASAREFLPHAADCVEGLVRSDIDPVPTKNLGVDLTETGRVNQGAVDVETDRPNRIDDHWFFSTSRR